MESPEKTKQQKQESLLLIEEGDRLQSLNDFLGSINAYSSAIEKDPFNAYTYYKRSWSRAQTGDIKGELEDWEKAIEINPAFEEAYADRVAALRNYKGVPEDAKIKSET